MKNENPHYYNDDDGTRRGGGAQDAGGSGGNDGYQVTSSYLPLRGLERGHRNADNEKAMPEDTEDLSIICRLVGLDYSFPAETNKERMLPGTDQALRQAQDSF